MKRSLRRILFILILFVMALGYLEGANKKLAQTGFQFLSIAPDAKASAMGEAVTAVEGYSNSLFFNPASMARMNSFLDVNMSQNQWIADINHNAVSMAIAPVGGKYGVFGFSLLSVDYGDLQGTMVAANQDGYVDTEVFNPTALALGIGYARALSDKFAVGGQIKRAFQYLGKSVIPDSVNAAGEVLSKKIEKNIANAVAFDFGTLYRTGWKSLAFGMSVRNFSDEIKYQSEGFQLPLTFQIGISMNILELIPGFPSWQSLLVSIDASHPRSYSERMNLGMEYKLGNLVAFRGGYKYNYDERGLTAGFGIQKQMKKFFLGVDYAYTPFGVFDNVQRLSIQIAL